NINNEGGEESKALSNSEQMNLPVYFIPSLVDILVSEKRMQYRECTGLEIEIDLENSFGLFSRINSNELKRALSNLINNAIEALNNHQGKVIVGVRKINNDGTLLIEISVKDNGKGIPKNLISKLGQSEISFGKTSSKESGSGLGLYHAKRMAEYFGGRLKIESTEGSGSTICLILPLSENPQWFANMIDLTNKTFLISLDDDISIHQIWSDRLQSLNLKRLEHIKFQSCDAFEKYVNANINKLGQTLFLVDHELLNQNKTGLELIEELGLEKYSILVTSHYEDLKIQNQSLRLNLPILPKSLAGFVPIIIKS
ncbi:MAG: ATP-binding protein, partial [Pseudobdellovibrionaceae bacterium]